MEGEFIQQLYTQSDSLWGETAFKAREEGEGLSREDFVKELIEYWQDDVTGALSLMVTVVGETWAAADSQPAVTPTEPRPELTGEALASSVERGRGLYLQASTQCVSCHGARGLGNGSQTLTVQTDETTGEPYPEPGLHDIWGEVVQPRNLTRGVYRGGRRPIDLYRRVHSGIAASKMPGFGDNLSEAEIWDLVNFIYALPQDPSLLDGAVAEQPPGHDGVAAGGDVGESPAVPALPSIAAHVEADRS
jgi:mono/diheme cytochrome c family protein